MSFPANSPAAPVPRRSLRILYADDMRELREIARMSFTREGHSIECVVDGVSAVNRISEDPHFDLVITDHHMPNMDGLELVRRLRELRFAGKIMVFSSELSANVMNMYHDFGVDRILYKPVFPSALRQALAELFSLPTSNPVPPPADPRFAAKPASAAPLPLPKPAQ